MLESFQVGPQKLQYIVVIAQESSHGVSISGHQSQVVVLNSAEKYFGLLESIIIK